MIIDRNEKQDLNDTLKYIYEKQIIGINNLQIGALVFLGISETSLLDNLLKTLIKDGHIEVIPSPPNVTKPNICYRLTISGIIFYKEGGYLKPKEELVAETHHYYGDNIHLSDFKNFNIRVKTDETTQNNIAPQAAESNTISFWLISIIISVITAGIIYWLGWN